MPRGIFTVEASLAIVITVGLMILFTAFAMQNDKALRSFNDKRAAIRLAEETLLAMHNAPPTDDARIRIRRLETASESPSKIWVEVTATIDGRAASLTGQVPASSMKETK
jgi:hypothetical protein